MSKNTGAILDLTAKKPSSGNEVPTNAEENQGEAEISTQAETSPREGISPDEAGGPEEEEQKTEVEALRDTVKHLQAQMNELARTKATLESTKEPEPESEPPVDFSSNVDLDNFLTPEGLNHYAGNIVEETVKRVVLGLQGQIKNTVKNLVGSYDEYTNYMSENPDLRGFKDMFALAVREVESSNQDWEIKQIYEEAGNRVRQAAALTGLLQASPETQVQPEPQKRKPSAPPTRGSAGPTISPSFDGLDQKRENVQDRIRELLKLPAAKRR